MKTSDVILAVQTALQIPEDKRYPRVGPLTKAAFNKLANLSPDAEYTPPISSELADSGRNINDRGLALVQHFESLFLQAYEDIANVWTIGWGHTGLVHNDGTVYRGRMITREKADQLLRYDMDQTEAQVSALVKNTLNDDQFDALVSFHFNTGGLDGSTLLKRLNEGNYTLAAKEFLRWNKVDGKVVKGLTRRRMSEKNLFESVDKYLVETI